MLSDFPYVNLPNDLLEILKGEYHNGKDSLTKLSIAVESKSGLSHLVKKTMGSFDPDRRVEAIIKNLGFEAFRSRLSSVYLHKFEFDHYPSESNLDRVQAITDFNISIQDLSVMNSSRAYLLALYLDFATVQKKLDGELAHLNIPTEVVSFLKLKSSKNTKLDWLLLLVWHFVEYFGLEEFKSLLQKYNNEYENIYLSMNEDSRFKMMANMLSYGASIQDMDTFIYERV